MEELGRRKNPEQIPGMHFDNLYDEDEDRAGEKIDPATGKKINNSPVVTGADEKLSVIEPQGEDSEDILGALPNEKDAAAKWLEENDPGSLH